MATTRSPGIPRQASRTVHEGARDANRALAAFVTEVGTGVAPIDGKVTLDVFLQRWLEHLEPHREAQTIRGYRFGPLRPRRLKM